MRTEGKNAAVATEGPRLTLCETDLTEAKRRNSHILHKEYSN